jgi:hypothetical protein
MRAQNIAAGRFRVAGHKITSVGDEEHRGADSKYSVVSALRGGIMKRVRLEQGVGHKAVFEEFLALSS